MSVIYRTSIDYCIMPLAKFVARISSMLNFVDSIKAESEFFNGILYPF